MIKGLVGAGLALSFGLGACKTPAPSSRVLDTAAAGAAAPSAAVTTAADDAARVAADPPGSLLALPPHDYAVDLPQADNSRYMQPVVYANTVVASQGRTPPLPLRLATNTVLQQMRKNLAATSMSIPGEPTHTPSGFGGLAPTIAEIKAKGWMNVADDSDIYSKAPNDPWLKSRCIAYGIPHYSDVMVHYYCQMPGLWRACHRLALFAFENQGTGDKTKAADSRNWATKTCLSVSDSDFDTNFASMFNVSGPALSTMSFPFNSYTEAKASRTYFQAMYAAQVATNDKGESVNVFDYIMTSQTYAFDWQDQNAVINTFYADMVPATEPAWDPNNVAACLKWRTNRAEENMSANYCLAATPKISPIFAIGR